MSLAEYLLLAVGSIFWPLLFTIVLLALRTARPVPLLAAFLVAGLLTCIAVGLGLVLTFDGTRALSSHRHTVDPVVDVVAGLLALAVASRLRRRPPRRRRTHRSRLDASRVVANAKVAFAAGIVLNVVPGFLPFVALLRIAEADYGPTANVVLVTVFYVIMFASVEVPLAGYLVAPDATVAAVRRWNAWLDRNARRVAVLVLATAGAVLVARGAVAWLR